MSSRVGRKANPPSTPDGGEALLPRGWQRLTPEVRAGKDKALRDLWESLDPGQRALIIDTWLDGWIAGHQDRPSFVEALLGRHNLTPDPFLPLLDGDTRELE